MSVPSRSSSSGTPKGHSVDQDVPKLTIEPSNSFNQAGPSTTKPSLCDPAVISIAQAESAPARNPWIDPAVVDTELSTVVVSVLPTMPYNHPRVAPPFRTVLSPYASIDRAEPSTSPSENYLTRRRSQHVRENRRPSRQGQNYRHNRDNMGTEAMRRSQILTARMRGTELYSPYSTPSQNPSPPQLTTASNVAAFDRLQNIHQMLNLYLPPNSPSRFPSRYPSQFLRRSPSQPPHSYNLPYLSQGPMDVNQAVVPLDLSVPTRLTPKLCPRLKIQPVGLHTQHVKFCPVPRPHHTTPRTHTVTSSTSNPTDSNTPSSLLMHTHLSDREELDQTRSRLELYASCSDHLLNQPSNQRPPDPLPEHLQYRLLHIDTTVQIEEVGSSVCDLGDTAPAPDSDESAVDGTSLPSTSLIPPPSRMATVPPSTLPSTSPRTTLPSENAFPESERADVSARNKMHMQKEASSGAVDSNSRSRGYPAEG